MCKGTYDAFVKKGLDVKIMCKLRGEQLPNIIHTKMGEFMNTLEIHKLPVSEKKTYYRDSSGQS